MRSKAPLVLMEQTVMLLVFALAAALCLKIFVWSDQHSQDSAALDSAVILTQNAAQLWKSARGDGAACAREQGSWDGQVWTTHYDETWHSVPRDGSFLLQVCPEKTDDPMLGKAIARMSGAAGEEIFSLTVCWQEVDRDGA